MKRHVRFVIVAVWAAAPGACVPGSDSGARVEVEFVFERHGGLCPTADGGGDMCRLEVVVRDDGTWSATGVPEPTALAGTVPTGAASELASIFNRRWVAMTSRVFEGVCPTAFDGSEIAYRVRRIPVGDGAEAADADVREVRSCMYDLTHSDAEYSLQLLSTAWEELDLPG